MSFEVGSGGGGIGGVSGLSEKKREGPILTLPPPTMDIEQCKFYYIERRMSTLDETLNFQVGSRADSLSGLSIFYPVYL